jgi:heme/copper-type cytochrome/quinol oxidase subunit 3
MLTGFHGFHVFVGMLMLLFITLRLQKGHFTASATSASKAPPGTGTLWTWSGWASTSWCTGCE